MTRGRRTYRRSRGISKSAMFTIIALLIVSFGLPMFIGYISDWSDNVAFESIETSADAPEYLRAEVVSEDTNNQVTLWQTNSTSYLGRYAPDVFYSNVTGNEYNTVMFGDYNGDDSGYQDKVYFILPVNSTSAVESGVTSLDFYLRTSVAVEDLEVRTLIWQGYDLSETAITQYALSDYLTITVDGETPTVADGSIGRFDVSANTWYHVRLTWTETGNMVCDTYLDDDLDELGLLFYLRMPADHDISGDVWDFKMEIQSESLPVSTVANFAWGFAGVGLIACAIGATPMWNMTGRR